MPLSGYQKSRTAGNGGIALLGLILSTEIDSIVYSPSLNAFTRVNFSDGGRFRKYEFREDEAEYNEKIVISNGAQMVTHQIKFLIDKFSGLSTGGVDELIEGSQQGIIAIVVTDCGDAFLVGYSYQFNMQRALSVDSCIGSTGSRFSTTSTQQVLLQSIDGSTAKPFIGNIHTLFE